MAKKSATYLDYEVIVEDNSSITVKKGGQHIPNVMGAIREIASITGYVINEKSNTRQNGAKLVDYLKALPAEAATPTPETEATPAAQPTPAPVPTPVAEPEPIREPEPSAPETAPTPQVTPAEPTEQEQNQTSETEELGEEEMKQIDDLIKRLEALETRIAKLERTSNNPSPKATNTKLTVTKFVNLNSIRGYKFNTDGNVAFMWWTMHTNNAPKYLELLKGGDNSCILTEDIPGYNLALLSDGSIKTVSRIGSTLREVKAFATLIGYSIPDKAKAETLAAAIVNEHGSDGVCISSGQMLKSNGSVFSLGPVDFREIIKTCKDRAASFIFGVEPPTLSGKSPEEALESLFDFYDAITPRPLPPSDKLIAQFEQDAKNYQLRNS